MRPVKHGKKNVACQFGYALATKGALQELFNPEGRDARNGSFSYRTIL